MRLWNISTGNCLKTFETYNSFITDAVFNCNGTHCLIKSSNNEVSLFDIVNNRFIASLKDAKSQIVYSMDVSQNGNYCLIGGEHLLFWDVRNNKAIELNKDMIHEVAISKSGKYGFVSTKNSAIMYDLKGQTILFKDDVGYDGSVYITQDEKFCLIGRKDNRVSIHQLNTGKVVYVIENVEQLVGNPRRITLSPSGNICLIIQGSIDSLNYLKDSIVRFVDILHDEVLYESDEQKGTVWFSSFLDSENICITSDLHNSYIWDIDAKRLLQELPPPKTM